jgi:hypothetical protein
LYGKSKLSINGDGDFSGGSQNGLTIDVSTGRVGIGTTAPDQLLSVNGNASKIGGGTWATFSDRNLKKDIVPFNEGLSVILKINPVRFKYNGMAKIKNTTEEFIGIIAQDMQQVAPYTIKTSKIQVSESELNLFPMGTTKFIKMDTISVTEAGKNTPQSKTIKMYESELLSYDPNAIFYLLVNSVKELDKQNKDLKLELQLLNDRIAKLEGK